MRRPTRATRLHGYGARHDTRPDRRPTLLARSRRRHRRRDLDRAGGRRERPPHLPRLRHRRSRPPQHVRPGRRAAVDRHLAGLRAPALRSAVQAGGGLAAQPAGEHPPHGRAAHRALHLGRGDEPRLAIHRGPGARPDGDRTHRAGRLRPPPGRQGAAGAARGPRARCRLPVPAQRHGARSGRRPRPGRLLHRGRGARLQRLHLHRPRHLRHPLRHRERDRGCHRRTQGSAPRRRPGGGREPAQ